MLPRQLFYLVPIFSAQTVVHQTLENGQYFIYKEPVVGSNYQPNQDKSTVFSSSDANPVSVRFIETFLLEDPTGWVIKRCEEDKVFLFVDEVEYGNFCGDEGPTETFVGHNIDVRFQTNGDTEREGFTVLAKGYSPTLLENVQVDPQSSGYLSNPSELTDENGEYTADIDITFSISSDAVITLKIEYLDIEEDANCQYDSLVINGQIFCNGKETNIEFEGTSHDISFFSDSGIGGQGWSISYTVGELNTTSTTTTTTTSTTTPLPEYAYYDFVFYAAEEYNVVLPTIDHETDQKVVINIEINGDFEMGAFKGHFSQLNTGFFSGNCRSDYVEVSSQLYDPETGAFVSRVTDRYCNAVDMYETPLLNTNKAYLTKHQGQLKILVIKNRPRPFQIHFQPNKLFEIS